MGSHHPRPKGTLERTEIKRGEEREEKSGQFPLDPKECAIATPTTLREEKVNGGKEGKGAASRRRGKSQMIDHPFCALHEKKRKGIKNEKKAEGAEPDCKARDIFTATRRVLRNMVTRWRIV